MANLNIKNNLVEICGNSDANSNCVNDVQKNTGSVSFSDSCSHKRSAVQNINTKMDVLIKCMNLKQSNSAVTLSTTLKIFHQNIRSLRNKMNELFCCIQEDSPHILCLTEHHLQHSELVLQHIDNYTLGAYYCRNTKCMGGVCMFVQNNIPFTGLEIGNYCKD